MKQRKAGDPKKIAAAKRLTKLEPGLMREFLKGEKDVNAFLRQATGGIIGGSGARITKRETSGPAPAVMPHRKPRRKKYDQTRTPWQRLGPREKAILDAGWAHVQSVPYRVSTRWLFYRLLQDGFYKGKGDYKNNYMKLIARARHTYLDGWRPDTLEDEGRDFILRVDGCRDEPEAVELMRAYILDAANLRFNHFHRQENYVELWFEAKAMAAQFEHYTNKIDLVPMFGEASIPYKWKIAKRLEQAASFYDKPIHVLYFGDADPSGHKIMRDVEKDVRRWCSAGFEIVWAGLTIEQAKRYKIPERPEKPGYQWEALSDKAAEKIITSAVGKYLDTNLIEEADAAADAFAEKWREKLEAALDELAKGGG